MSWGFDIVGMNSATLAWWGSIAWKPPSRKQLFPMSPKRKHGIRLRRWRCCLSLTMACLASLCPTPSELAMLGGLSKPVLDQLSLAGVADFIKSGKCLLVDLLSKGDVLTTKRSHGFQRIWCSLETTWAHLSKETNAFQGYLKPSLNQKMSRFDSSPQRITFPTSPLELKSWKSDRQLLVVANPPPKLLLMLLAIWSLLDVSRPRPLKHH